MTSEKYTNATIQPIVSNQLAESRIEDVERQAVHAAMHAHTIDSALAGRIHALESTVYGLVDLLVNKRLVGESELTASANCIAQTIEDRGERAHGGVAIRVDPPEPQPVAAVNCAERIPICKAVCCRLTFPLTTEEIQDGHLKWELGQPYFIRHDERGACVHQDRSTCLCAVYSERPNLCKHYSCQADKRIWKDFAKMILNQEWIDANLQGQHPQLVQIQMARF